jgi:hypothetical protein
MRTGTLGSAAILASTPIRLSTSPNQSLYRTRGR